MMLKRFIHLIALPLRYLGDVLRYLTKEGNWRLSSLHQQIVDAVLDHIGNPVAQIVRDQLKCQFFRGSWNEGRINPVFYYDQNRIPLIPDPAFEERLFKVSMRVDGRKQVAHVTFHDGRFYSVEFKKPWHFFKDKKIEILEVTVGRSSETVTRAIDRSEHGREVDTNN